MGHSHRALPYSRYFHFDQNAVILLKQHYPEVVKRLIHRSIPASHQRVSRMLHQDFHLYREAQRINRNWIPALERYLSFLVFSHLETDKDIQDHSSLSKARAPRRIVFWLCAQAALPSCLPNCSHPAYQFHRYRILEMASMEQWAWLQVLPNSPQPAPEFSLHHRWSDPRKSRAPYPALLLIPESSLLADWNSRPR